MQRMCKQSPKQSVGLHDIRLHTKKAALPKITWTYRGAAAPSASPLDPPLAVITLDAVVVFTAVIPVTYIGYFSV